MTFKSLIGSLLLASSLIAAPQFSLAGGHHSGMNYGHSIEQLKQKLDISDEQAEKVKTILSQSREQHQKLMSDYGLEPGKGRENKGRLSRDERKALRSKMMAVKQSTKEQLSGVLSKEQMEQLHAMKAERKQQRHQHRQNKNHSNQSS
ncbi:MAG: hypothetical protein OIF38_15950 [Cellvibrionaceae bacterium]|nr:hypothetical protein [Cellvibrionaceae bacterium]